MLRCIINLCRKGLVYIRILKETEFELELEDIAYGTVDFLFRYLAFLDEFFRILDEAI